jgi:tetratricopeptide (TPR) repeat protein
MTPSSLPVSRTRSLPTSGTSRRSKSLDLTARADTRQANAILPKSAANWVSATCWWATCDGGQVQVNVQLIDTHDAGHPWLRAYNRPLSDVFVVQSEITRAIADQLQTPLSAAEKNAINEPPTTDLAAYDLYLRALEIPEFVTNIAASFASYTKQVSLLDAAVARDPKFVLAYCALAGVHDSFYEYRNYASPEDQKVDHRALAEAALQSARRLRPDDGEVHLAAAKHFLLANRDNEQARLELDLARRTLPNSVALEKTAGLIARAQGRWEDALRAMNRAAALDPRDVQIRDDLDITYRILRRYRDFEREKLGTISMVPGVDAARERADLAMVCLERDADLSPLRASLAALPKAEYNAGDDVFALVLHLFEHDADAVSRVVASAPVSKFMINGCIYPKGWFEALAARMRGDEAGAQRAFAAARLDAAEAVSMDATNGLHLSMLAMIDAGLGRTDAAVREGLRACEILPPEMSVHRSIRVSVNLAVVYAWTGKTDLAIARLEKLVRGPSGLSVPIQPSYGDLKLNPIWNPLRGDARFGALMQTLAPRTPAVK